MCAYSIEMKNEVAYTVPNLFLLAYLCESCNSTQGDNSVCHEYMLPSGHCKQSFGHA